MRRILVLSGLAAVAAALALPALSSAGSEQTIGVGDDFFNPKNAGPIDVNRTTVQWSDAGAIDDHNVREKNKLFYSGQPTQPLNFTITPSAGTFKYICEIHAVVEGMRGTLKVRPDFDVRPEGAPFTVIWGSSESDTGNAYDVRYRVAGTQKWKTWKNDTKSVKGVFGKGRKPVAVNLSKEYELQVRSEKASNPKKASGFSPTLTADPDAL
jgi:plastocyanin